MDASKKTVDDTITSPLEETRESRKRMEKERKKGEKKMEQFMKTIMHLPAEEKIEALCKRNTDCFEDIKTLKGSIQILQRKIAALDREKEVFQNEQSKGVLTRSRLENLCRELQRQNKSIKDESLQKIREEEEKRKEVSSRFQSALNEVSQMMQKNTDKNLKLREDNIDISNKFHKLCEQFKLREDEVIRLTKQMDLEKQLAEATVKRIECQVIAEREMWCKEKEHYIDRIKVGEQERVKLQTNMKSLEDNLSMYSTRYDEFETTITKSNQVFDSYKNEMATMTKQVNRLERESNSWKERWIQTQQAFTKVNTERKIVEDNLQDREKKLKNVSDLCRTLQEERTMYLKQLKEHGISPAAIVTERGTPKVERFTKKEKQLAELKKEMASLETQLTNAQLCSNYSSTSLLSNDTDSVFTTSEDVNNSVETIQKTEPTVPESSQDTNSSSIISSDKENVDVPLEITGKKISDILVQTPENIVSANTEKCESTIPVQETVSSNDTEKPEIAIKPQESSTIPPEFIKSGNVKPITLNLDGPVLPPILENFVSLVESCLESSTIKLKENAADKQNSCDSTDIKNDESKTTAENSEAKLDTSGQQKQKSKFRGKNQKKRRN